MAGNSVFDELYSEGMTKDRDTLKNWWDVKNTRFGGEDALATARQLLGGVAKYDFSTVAGEIPKLDLPQLEPFFRVAMQKHGRRVTRSDAGLSVATPEIMRNDLELKPRYDGLQFDRTLPPQDAMSRMMGVGHVLMDKLLDHASAQQVFTAILSGLEAPTLLVKVEDEITGTKATVHRVILGYQGTTQGFIRDGDLLLALNGCALIEQPEHKLENSLTRHVQALIDDVSKADLPAVLGFRHPKARPIMVLLPAPARPACATENG
jgi:hypothetical protein